MPWKYGSVTLKEGKSWTDDNGRKHPPNESGISISSKP